MSGAAGIRRVGVVGAGFMGAGIAQVAAQAGYEVDLVDVDEEALPAARQAIEASLAKLHAKGAVAEPPEAVLKRIGLGVALDVVSAADLVIEAVFERVDVKHALLTGLEGLCRPDAILASNTSAIPIGVLAKPLKHRGRLAGMHFFSPVPVNPLVELIAGPATDEAVMAALGEAAQRMGKTAVRVKKDVAGFIMNRMFTAMAAEAIELLDEGVATIEDVDLGMTTGYGMTIGPLTIADLVGLDVCLHVFENIRDLGRGGPRPPALLQRLVREGKLGRKTGEGFYRYDAAGKKTGPAL